MVQELDLSIRELEIKDISFIADYWLLSPSEHLESMGVDLNKVPTKTGLINYLKSQIATPNDKKESFALIWEVGGVPIGHSNVNELVFGQTGKMHLHIWSQEYRKKGIGLTLLKMSLPFYFNELKLEELICEPFASNLAPNKTLNKIGFKFIKKYRTTPGSLNFEQEVNQWSLSKKDFLKLN